MGAHLSKQVERRKTISAQKKTLSNLRRDSGDEFPGSDDNSSAPSDRKNWMSSAEIQNLPLRSLVWPGSHDSATNRIGIRCITRPFAKCQSLSVYQQLCMGTRVLDIRVQEDRRVCHGVLLSYNVSIVLSDVKRFLQETQSEIIILEVRTEFGHLDPPDFDKYLVEELGEFLIHQDDAIFSSSKTVAEVLPRRIICVWKGRKTTRPPPGGPLWGGGYLRDDWIDTDLPWTKFESNLKHLGEQKDVTERRYFYRVENTATPQADNPVVCVKPVAKRMHGHARLFINQCFARGCGEKLQIFSTDFIDRDFVDACVSLCHARAKSPSLVQ